MANILTYPTPTLMEQTKSELQQLREDLLQCSIQLKQFALAMQGVEDFLLGSKFSKGTGFIDSHKEHDTRIKQLEEIRVKRLEEDVNRFKLFTKWTLATVGIISGVVGSLITFVWNIIKH